MRLLEHSYDSPAENLALDEALLDEAEAGRGAETLRFWQSPVHFVVLGLSQAVDEHVFRDACASDGIPILRRCSAGGCVLQGPGCLNYSLVLKTDRAGCESIHASYRTILGAMSSAFDCLGLAVKPAGISDLSLNGNKVSGSAQRRRKNYFLHHGTLLFDFDIALCSKYLRDPSDQPEYRGRRSHELFISNLNIDLNTAKRAVSGVFQANELSEFSTSLQEMLCQLVHVRYSDPSWHFRR